MSRGQLFASSLAGRLGFTLSYLSPSNRLAWACPAGGEVETRKVPQMPPRLEAGSLLFPSCSVGESTSMAKLESCGCGVTRGRTGPAVQSAKSRSAQSLLGGRGGRLFERGPRELPCGASLEGTPRLQVDRLCVGEGNQAREDG